MWEDPIVRELHEIRQAHAEKFSYDLKAICEDIRKEEGKKPHKQAKLPIKRKAIREQATPSS